MTDFASIVELYFSLGLSQSEIQGCLYIVNGISVSIRTIQRALKKRKLFRRKNFSDILDVSLFISGELDGSGKLHGYKLMHHRCLRAGFAVTQETVRLLLRILDPEGVRRRKTGTIKRRIYISKGPNFLWHIDSYDKLKPFGLCINGAIDGFSRNVVWLKVYNTNSDPKVIASYFLDGIQAIGGCPTRIRADFGTENCRIKEIQNALRYDHGDAFARRSFIYGNSVLNQRIESWWAFLRRHCVQYWIDLFHELKNQDLYSGDYLDRNLIQFVFTNILQRELNDIVSTWNTHKIRKVRGQNGPHGRPVVMYTLPALYGTTDCMHQVPDNVVQLCEQYVSPVGPTPCNKDFFDLCCLLMEERNLTVPDSGSSGVACYEMIRRDLRAGL